MVYEAGGCGAGACEAGACEAGAYEAGAYEAGACGAGTGKQKEMSRNNIWPNRSVDHSTRVISLQQVPYT